MKKWKLILLAALGIFAALQLTNPARTNPPVITDFITAAKPPAAVATSIRAACYDCHSYETKWPWYSRVAPVSWLIVSDTDEGREKLDFSDWPDEAVRAAKKMDRINEVLGYREMPPKKYTLIHADARLTEAQRKEIMDWTDAAAAKLRAASTNE
ncbi:MAG TPA: hypothetical protein DCQ92_19160 [Verrucomicrobia subdivision 3 bacterium]|nr:hypothetical protein [Limisphaerales bacterium]